MASTVMTVTGPLPVDQMGVTLTHEHILSDVGCNGAEPSDPAQRSLYHAPLQMEILGEVRLRPQGNRDNQMLTSRELAAAEVRRFAALGGKTILELTLDGFGRDPEGLRWVSQQTGVNIVMGTGFYIELAHPPRLKGMSAAEIAAEIEGEIREGTGPAKIRPGIIGEIGVDQDFSSEEEKSLRGAAMASARTGLPILVHTSGGSARTHEYRARILDLLAGEGVDLRRAVIAHCQLCPIDLENQMALAACGAFLGYDGISCDFYWGERGRGLTEDASLANLKRLIDAGFLHQILLSHDVHLKIMLSAYGGFGYTYILRRFTTLLREYGVTEAQIHTLLVENPRRLFSV